MRRNDAVTDLQEHETHFPVNARAVFSACATSRRTRGLSLVESLVSSLIVAGLVVVSLNLFASSAAAGSSMNRKARAMLLAQDLMSEILERTYVEPTGLDVLFGPELVEINGTRSKFDDVDDYDGWNASPPQRLDGTAMTGQTGWRRKVQVRYAQAGNLATISVTDQGVKRITVWVCWKSATCDASNALATLVAVRTNTPYTESKETLLDTIIEILPLKVLPL